MICAPSSILQSLHDLSESITELGASLSVNALFFFPYYLSWHHLPALEALFLGQIVVADQALIRVFCEAYHSHLVELH